MGNKTSTNKIYKLYMKDYLIVYGHNISRGCSCYKETEIQRNELVKYMPIIKKIHDTKDGLEKEWKEESKRKRKVVACKNLEKINAKNY